MDLDVSYLNRHISSKDLGLSTGPNSRPSLCPNLFTQDMSGNALHLSEDA